MRRTQLALTLLALPLLALTLLLGATPGRAAEAVDVEALLNGADDVTRGRSSTATVIMEVRTERYERSVTMKVWTSGTEQSLIIIQSPEKEKGVATLKVDDNIWNYMPRIDRTVKVPANMMSGAWMGSHITNDDLVRENRLAEQFTWVVQEEPRGGEGRWVIELTPRPDAPVVWGRVVAVIGADRLPQEIRYYDEQGGLVRTMSYDEVRELDGRRVPTRFTVTPADKPGEYTRMRYEDLDFDAEIPPGTFTLQALRP